MTKKISFSIFLIFAAGFFLGRFSANKISTKKEVAASSQIQTQKKDKVNVSDIKKDSNLSQQMSYVEKFYNPKGKLAREIIVNNKIGASEKLGITTRSKIDNFSQNASSQESNTTIEYQSNWILGSYLPINNLNTTPNFYDLNLSISYRIIGNIYLSGMTNIKFNKIQIGVQYQF